MPDDDPRPSDPFDELFPDPATDPWAEAPFLDDADFDALTSDSTADISDPSSTLTWRRRRPSALVEGSAAPPASLGATTSALCSSGTLACSWLTTSMRTTSQTTPAAASNASMLTFMRKRVSPMTWTTSVQARSRLTWLPMTSVRVAS